MIRRTIAAAWAVGCLLAVLGGVTLTETGAGQPDTKVTKDGGVYKLQVGDKTVAESKHEIRDAKVVPVPEGAGQSVTWMAPTAADAAPVAFYAVRLGDGEWSRPKSTTYQIRLQNRSFDPAKPTTGS
jgi:hypothetical protein